MASPSKAFHATTGGSCFLGLFHNDKLRCCTLPGVGQCSILHTRLYALPARPNSPETMGVNTAGPPCRLCSGQLKPGGIKELTLPCTLVNLACLLRPCHCCIVADAICVPYASKMMHSPHASSLCLADADAMPYNLFASCTLHEYSQVCRIPGEEATDVSCYERKSGLTRPALAGDILDGYHPKAESKAALEDLLQIFDALKKPHWHMIGNHCLYNLPRQVYLPQHHTP